MNFIFDLGNVLIDWDPKKFISKYDLSSQEKIDIEKHLFAHADWLALDQGIKSQEDVINNVALRSGLNTVTVKYSIDEMKKSLDTIEKSAVLLRELSEHGFGLFCLSNMSHDTYNHLKGREFFKYFDDIIISADVKMIKPDIQIFEYALDRFKLKASETVFIDDSEPNIIAAQSLNIHCVHFSRTADCYRKIAGFM